LRDRSAGARPIAFTLIAANTLILILSSIYFFAVPILLSGLAAVCLSVASVRLSKLIPKPNR
jgi:predicted PurR-regulated permease PerM